ncbi:MAG: glycoside hydrolase family 15 protein [Alphaproteobacteria bacterium]
MTDSLELGVIGNCAFGALIDDRGRIVWSCLPRFDGDPVFCQLLNDGAAVEADTPGVYQIELTNMTRSEQEYVKNTAVLVTRLYDAAGGVVQITDFAPRFGQFGRMFRPAMIVRIVRPLAGMPQVRVVLRPAHGYGAHRPETTHGSNHIRYVSPPNTLRLTTDAPLAYLLDETPFFLEEPITLVLGPDESLLHGVAETGHDFFEKTIEYWRGWSRGLALPLEWQDAVIRAAITLKLCSFEETGAIIAAMTTSIPEAKDSGRNWDYRYCWLRDAYFVVRALNRLGAVVTMEHYLRYLTNIIGTAENGHLQPVYGISLERRLRERQIDTLSGYRGMGPVRVGNQAHEHEQHDVYGHVVLATIQTFFDDRLFRPAGVDAFRRLEAVGERAFAVHDKPDAGLWELRGRARVHTSSVLMCWAACDRLAKVAAHLGLPARIRYWQERANTIRETLLREAWNGELDTFTESFGGSDVDASLLLIPEVGFLRPDDPRYRATVTAIEAKLRHGKHLFRYAAPDDFGTPENAFTICTFWFIESLAAIGRAEEAREMFESVLACRNRLGLLSEDIDPVSGELWGNFPQTYSLVGLIHCAMRLSRGWEEVL